MKSRFNIKDILDIEHWEQVQDSLAAVTKLAMITVDYKGRPLTSHSKCSDFCRKVREDESLSQFCQKCDSMGGIEAVRTEKPYLYKCYFSIIDIAIPIIIEDHYVGAIMAGQVRLRKEDDKEALVEQIFLPASQKLVNEKREKLKEEYEKIPVLSLEEIKRAATLIYDLQTYATNHIQKEELQREEQIAQTNKESSIVTSLEYIDTTNELILKAFNYIKEHQEESPSLEKIAKYCHVSTSYLSRLFSKEVGESYTSFTSRLKTEWAKALLEMTNKTIVEISDELGFNDPSYFIKIFKKYVGLTPLAYRSYLR
ncbi:MAG TPA: PocR ligand-binding domain-containing protein [Candidatus Dorea intestinavium]|nr:PocR ligand-binding domain-containing protein [Candidatus Dorea intestinavium]